LNEICENFEIKALIKNIEIEINPLIFEVENDKIESLLNKYEGVDKYINIFPIEFLGDKERLT
jgi:hypothetical protein